MFVIKVEMDYENKCVFLVYFIDIDNEKNEMWQFLVEQLVNIRISIFLLFLNIVLFLFSLDMEGKCF